ncbi:hypothetical protein ES703_70716 [subsurface metagenome]
MAKAISPNRLAGAIITSESLWMSIIALAAPSLSGGLENFPIDILPTCAAICSLEGIFLAIEAGRIASTTNGSRESTRPKIAFALISSSGWAVTKSAAVPGRCETVPIPISARHFLPCSADMCFRSKTLNRPGREVPCAAAKG